MAARMRTGAGEERVVKAKAIPFPRARVLRLRERILVGAAFLLAMLLASVPLARSGETLVPGSPILAAEGG